ncbi:hypothetical protein F511_06915 [Dorcoceras hygrometricum]|uniref:Uncharacterized protein n=1 Tax=Dorcoceras hygrometricum TaxID=472368 RepID=A0A2Z7B2X6_9LAMI|nr:hypothetical protein F511_06915 [Dorcoceras hygrometricum]
MESGLSGFLGCPSVLNKDALTEFFLNGSVRDGKVVSTFELPVDGLTDLSKIPNDIVFDERSIFSLSGEQRKRRLALGSDDEIVGEPTTVAIEVETDVGRTNDSGPDVEDKGVKTANETELWFNLSYEEFATREANRPVETGSDTEETFVTEKVTATDFGVQTETGVDEGDWYKASLPKIHPADKRKAPLQVAAAALDNVEVRKEVKEQRTMITDLDEQVATSRSELLDFRAKAEENHLNLSTQLGFLVDYINRGGDAKKGKGSSSGPQSPPDDQSRPSGGSGSGGGSANREGGDGRRRGDSSGSSKRRSSDSGGGSGGRINYGPYLPPKRDAEYWISGKR